MGAPYRYRYAVRLSAIGLGLTALGWSSHASADEPRKVTEPMVLREPTEITNVVDAFDDGDDFDLHLSLGFQQTWRSAKVRRESGIPQAGLGGGGYTANTLNVAQYKQSTSRLNTRADIGVFKDIALFLRLPIILSDSRELNDLDGSARNQAIALQGEPGERLFTLPFKGPTRSGIEYLAVGANFGLMNQWRDSSKPTWVVGLEGRFQVSEPMHACNDGGQGTNRPGQQQKCADSSDIDRDGRGEEAEFNTEVGNLEGVFNGGRQAGVSRGTTALQLHTYLSKRIKYIEPYGGFEALFEFQNGSSDYGATDLKGSLVNHPPLRGTMLLGTTVIPYEVRDKFQRLYFDFRFTGTYVSEGRDYSELFDALGSSDANSLRYPQFSEYQSNSSSQTSGTFPSVVNPNSQKVYFTGLTDVQQHGEYKFSAEAGYQAGEYVKFKLGAAYTLVQGHVISFDQPCNPEFNQDIGKSGPCRKTSEAGLTGAASQVTGIPNPNYRAPINVPGRRFRVDDSSWFDLWVSATVMF